MNNNSVFTHIVISTSTLVILQFRIPYQLDVAFLNTIVKYVLRFQYRKSLLDAAVV